jgi:hypothetical protein
MTVIHSENVLLEDIYVNSTDTSQAVGFDFSSLNTDGADTIYANNITFRRWTVDNGDDSISSKQIEVWKAQRAVSNVLHKFSNV